jgi:hypothetical protein
MVSTQPFCVNTNRPTAITIMILSAKYLTEADGDQLSGRRASIISRGSFRATDPRGQFHLILNQQGVEAEARPL